MSRPTPRRWRAGAIEYDERGETLTVDGLVRAIEPIPPRLLHRLLTAGGEIVAKETLIESVWRSTRGLSDASFYNAMRRLRATLGEAGRDLVSLEPGRGYRITAPVAAVPSIAPPRPALTLAAGDPVPGRAQWRLAALLGAGERRRVWRAVHEGTGETRIFKFAEDAESRESLRRAMRASRRLREAAPEEDGFVSVLEAALDAQPAWLEMEDGGHNLAAWAQAAGGLTALPVERRVALLADAAAIVGAAHDVGVLHGNLTAAKILIDASVVPPCVRVAGFEAGDGFNRPTHPCTAPELQAGGAPTVAADIHALGVLLYQLLAGDLERKLAPGWERDVDDPLLRADIADTASGDPARRLSAAHVLAERLRTLPARHVALADARLDQAAAARLREAAEARRRRRPWITALCTAVLFGMIATGVALYQATRERAEAVHQAEIARSINQFLTEDLLGRGNPSISGDPKETLMAAAQAAEPMIDQRLGRQPLLAASLYLALATSFDGRREVGPAREAYVNSIAAFRQAEGPDGPDAVIVSLRRAILEVRAVQPGSIETARRLVADNTARVAGLGDRRREATAWLCAARATLQIGGGDMVAALADYAKASGIAETLPASFDPATRFWLRDRQGFSLIKLGRWAEARAVYEPLAREQEALHGPLHPNTLEARLHIAMIDAMSDKPAQAVAEADDVYSAMTKVFGPADKNTLLTLNARATALMALGRYDEVVRDDMTVHDQAAATQGADSFYAFSTLGHAGDAECRAGRTTSGIQKVEQALAISSRTLGESSPVTQTGRVGLAACHVLAGHGEDALPLLAHLDCRNLSTFAGQPGLCTDVNFIRRIAEAQQADRSQAISLLRGALISDGPEGDPFFAGLARRTLDSAERVHADHPSRP